MLWGAQYFKGNIFILTLYWHWCFKVIDKKKDNSNTNQFVSDQTLKEALGADLLDFQILLVHQLNSYVKKLLLILLIPFFAIGRIIMLMLLLNLKIQFHKI